MNKKNIISVLEEIILERGFTFLSEENGYFGYRYEDSNRHLSLGGGFADFKNNVIQGVSLNICFNKLEKVLNPTFETVGDNNAPSHMRPYVHKKITGVPLGEMIFNQFPFELKNESDLSKLKGLIELFWEQDARPFFEYWKDLRAFLPFIETSDISVIAEVLGNRIIEEKMIIWKLCNHPGYSGFVEQRKTLLVNALKLQPNNKDYAVALDNIVSMEEQLVHVEPIYDWDDSYRNPKSYKGVLPIILR